jgi:hypothetical protein
VAIGDQDIAYHVVAAVCAALTGGTSVGGDVEDVLLPPSVLAANLISFLPKSKTATTFLKPKLRHRFRHPCCRKGPGRRRMIAYGHVDFTCSEDIWNWDSWSNPVYFDQVGFDQVEFDQDVRITIAILPGED